jgi:hypothetical protein
VHRLDSLFGVVNVPSVMWIDEQGVIVRPPEPGWPGTASRVPGDMATSMPKLGRAPNAPRPPGERGRFGSGQDREHYADAVRDWVRHGPDSTYALNTSEVVVRSQPRPKAVSEAAAHFELANHLWRQDRRDLAIAHFNESHRLQPENWTYRRQAYSLVGNERVGGEFGRFVQGPIRGEEDAWPFDSDFRSEVSLLGGGEYYPKTL